MKERNTCLEKVKSEAKKELLEKLTKPDSAQYKQTLKQLVIQGMIKMLEPIIYLKCRKEDSDVL